MASGVSSCTIIDGKRPLLPFDSPIHHPSSTPFGCFERTHMISPSTKLSSSSHVARRSNNAVTQTSSDIRQATYELNYEAFPGNSQVHAKLPDQIHCADVPCVRLLGGFSSCLLTCTVYFVSIELSESVASCEDRPQNDLNSVRPRVLELHSHVHSLDRKHNDPHWLTDWSTTWLLQLKFTCQIFPIVTKIQTGCCYLTTI